MSEAMFAAMQSKIDQLRTDCAAKDERIGELENELYCTTEESNNLLAEARAEVAELRARIAGGRPVRVCPECGRVFTGAGFALVESCPYHKRTDEPETVPAVVLLTGEE